MSTTKYHFAAERQRVENYYRSISPNGATPDEAADKLGMNILTVRPAVSYLYNIDRLLERTGHKRPNASGRAAHEMRLAANPSLVVTGGGYNGDVYESIADAYRGEDHDTGGEG